MPSTTFAAPSLLVILVGTLSFVGCSAITFPIKGTPACCVPVDALVYPKRNLVQIDFAKLAQPQPEVYRLDKGDVIGVFVQGILPYHDADEPPMLPPVQYRESRMSGASIPPAVGFPVAVQANGEITLPAIGRIPVIGDSLEEVSEKIQEKCVEQNLDRDRDLVCIVKLINPRTYSAARPQEHRIRDSTRRDHIERGRYRFNIQP
jgi:protein involved in polysaccharide export with SLBB domain